MVSFIVLLTYVLCSIKKLSFQHDARFEVVVPVFFSGRLAYTLEVAKLRLFVHLRLANVRVQLLKTTIHTDDGTVRVRWRVSGISQARAIMFWNFLPWSKSASATDQE